MTAHSLSRRVRDLLAGDLGAHRDLPVDDHQEPDEIPPPVPDPAGRTVYSAEDAKAAWLKRRADLREMNGVNDQLDDVDRRVTELSRRAAALLSTETSVPKTGVGAT